MKRREFITMLGGAAAAWPLAARAQQGAVTVVGYLSAGSRGPIEHLIAILRHSLGEAGYVEGRNLAIEFHWAEGQYARMPALAAELVRRQVALIIAGSGPPALAAKVATATTPIVFSSADDPVKLGLVASLNRPDGNATGVYFFVSDLAAKQLELLRELVPAATRFALLVNPNNTNAGGVVREVAVAASIMGVKIDTVEASDGREIQAAFATLVRNRVDALVVGPDPFFYSRRLQLATLATRHAIPTVYNLREYAEAGGLITYGTSLTEAYRLLGTYVARILKGAKPADLPVVQSTKFDFVMNLSTARALGLNVPSTLLARADEVIE